MKTRSMMSKGKDSEAEVSSDESIDLSGDGRRIFTRSFNSSSASQGSFGYHPENLDMSGDRRRITTPSFDSSSASRENFEYQPENIDLSGDGRRIIVSRSFKSSSTSQESSERYRPADKSGFSFPIPFIVIIVAALIAALFINSCGSGTKCEITEETLRKEFGEQTKEFWAITRAILNGSKDSVKSIALLHTPDAEDTARCLAHRLANAFACNKSLGQIEILTPENLKSDGDYGKIIERYNGEFQGAFVVHNVDKVEEDAAQAFHSMCENVTPKSPPTLVVFTIPSDDVRSKPSATARKILRGAWGGLEENFLDPLLSRVLGYVTSVRGQSKNPCDVK